MSTSRSIYNPLQKDTVVFLETMMETGGKHSLIEVDMAPGGGNGLHSPKTYAETFECVEGEVKVQVGKTIHTLLPGDVATAHPNQLHRFFNDTDKACKFKVTISPGCKGFEEALQIAYGLARDGRVTSKGIPSNIYHLGYLLLLSESKLPGWQGVVEKAFHLVGKRALKNGVAAELRNKYVTIQ